MQGLGFELKREASLRTLTDDVVKSSAIEGESLNRKEVCSSVARRLGLDIAGLIPASRDVEGIVGRRVDAPHIIVPQGPVGKNDYEAREQGNIVQSLANNPLMQTRGHQTISLSPKHSPWKKPSGKRPTTKEGKESCPCRGRRVRRPCCRCYHSRAFQDDYFPNT